MQGTEAYGSTNNNMRKHILVLITCWTSNPKPFYKTLFGNLRLCALITWISSDIFSGSAAVKQDHPSKCNLETLIKFFLLENPKTWNILITIPYGDHVLIFMPNENCVILSCSEHQITFKQFLSLNRVLHPPLQISWAYQGDIKEILESNALWQSCWPLYYREVLKLE